MKDALSATITDGKSFRSHQELGAALQYAANTMFKAESQEWFDEYSAGLRGDNSYNYARAFNLIITDSAFMAKHGQTEYWKDVNTFMNIRTQVSQVYNAFPDGDSRKARFKDAYLNYIESNMAAFHPKLQTMFS